MERTSLPGRFSTKAETYAWFRPGYPDEIFKYIEKDLDVNRSCRIVDYGSGTGLFAEPFLQRGYKLVCIEPNADLHKVETSRLAKYPLFDKIHFTTEQTGLPAASVDLITIAHSRHWLDLIASQLAGTSILKPGGKVVLSQSRQKRISEFEIAYSHLQSKYSVEGLPAAAPEKSFLEKFFTSRAIQQVTFKNEQVLDFEGLKWQLLSKKNIPLPGHRLYDAMITDMIHIFCRYNEEGLVKTEYETTLYVG